MKGESVMKTDLFSDSQREEIRRAVTAAEEATSGEIVVLVLPESDRYREAEALGGVIFAALLALTVGTFLHHATVWFYIPLQFILFFPCRLLFCKVPRLKRPLLPTSRRESAVRERCLHAFYDEGVHRTREASGVLIFISLLERKVWIIGDRGINEKISPETWQELAGELSGGIREKRACATLCAVIARCGEILARQFPPKGDDVNELPDEVLENE